MIDTQNDFLFGSNGLTMTPLLPVVITSREQAYRTAAWIKGMAAGLPSDGSGDTYEEIEREINNT